MPSSAVRTFTDPDNYAAAIRATKAEVTVTRRGRFTAEITRIDLHRLWMQRFSDNLPRVGHSAGMSGRAIISFRTQPGPSLLWGSVEMHPNNIVRHGEGEGDRRSSTLRRNPLARSRCRRALCEPSQIPMFTRLRCVRPRRR